MNARFVTLVLSGLLAALLLPAEAHDSGRQMGASLKAATFELAHAHHMQDYAEVFQYGENLPDFANGYLISWPSHGTTAEAANVILRNSDGEVERSARIWLEGAERMDLSHATATEAGNIVVAGYAVLRPGTVAYFIAKTDLDGRITEVVRTNPLAPFLVCAATDGTVWSLGHDLGKDDPEEDYGMLRQYSFTAGQMRELLQRRSFGTGQPPVRGRSSTFLRCVQDRVLVYMNSTHEYFEILDSGETVRRFRVEPPQFGRRKIEAFAVLSDGSVFSTIGSRGDEPRCVYELQKSEEQLTASWVPVPGVGQSPAEGIASPPYGRLFGADRDSLVLSSKMGGLAWVRPQTRQQ